MTIGKQNKKQTKKPLDLSLIPYTTLTQIGSLKMKLRIYNFYKTIKLLGKKNPESIFRI